MSNVSRAMRQSCWRMFRMVVRASRLPLLRSVRQMHIREGKNWSPVEFELHGHFRSPRPVAGTQAPEPIGPRSERREGKSPRSAETRSSGALERSSLHRPDSQADTRCLQLQSRRRRPATRRWVHGRCRRVNKQPIITPVMESRQTLPQCPTFVLDTRSLRAEIRQGNGGRHPFNILKVVMPLDEFRQITVSRLSARSHLTFTGQEKRALRVVPNCKGDQSYRSPPALAFPA